MKLPSIKDMASSIWRHPAISYQYEDSNHRFSKGFAKVFTRPTKPYPGSHIVKVTDCEHVARDYHTLLNGIIVITESVKQVTISIYSNRLYITYDCGECSIPVDIIDRDVLLPLIECIYGQGIILHEQERTA
jgi:hypothetical protein